MNEILALANEDLRTLGNQGFSLAFRMLGHRDDAADAVQDAMHQMYRRQTTYRAGRGSVRSWFLKIVRNRCIDMQRKLRPAPAGEFLDPIDQRTGSPLAVSERDELVARVRQALAELSDANREIILLRDFHGLRYAEICEVLGLSSGTVMSRLHRARQQLRNKVIPAQGAD